VTKTGKTVDYIVETANIYTLGFFWGSIKEIILKIDQTIDVRANFEKVQQLLVFSKRAIARQAGITPGSLDGILKHNNPKIAQVVSLSRGLGVSVRYLIGGGDPTPELRANYVFEPMKPARLKPGWKPEVPNVAARVEIIMRQTGQKKCEASKRVNAMPGWWSSLLKKNNPTMRMLEKIAYATGVKPIDLVISVSSEEFSIVMKPKISY
jgi:transcriptional regulator with XRE-family HTH domain